MICGEIPFTVLDLMHPKRKWILQQIRTLKKEKYISVNGQGDKKTIRILDKGIAEISSEGTPLWEQYKQMVGDENMRSDFSHVYKNHRTAETLLLMQKADVGVAYWEKPVLLKVGTSPYTDAETFTKPVFYTSREIKAIDPEGDNRIRSARMTGLYVSKAGIYAVYNAFKGVMALPDEMKIRDLIRQLIVPNNWHRANAQDYETAGMRSIVICRNISAGIKILKENLDHVEHKKFSALDINNSGFKTVHFVPLNSDGTRLIKILACSNLQEKIAENCLTSERRNVQLSIDADGYDKKSGTYFFLLLDGDIKRYLHFARGVIGHDNILQEQCLVGCYPWQEQLVRSLLPNVRTQILEMKDVEAIFGLNQAERALT